MNKKYRVTGTKKEYDIYIHEFVEREETYEIEAEDEFDALDMAKMLYDLEEIEVIDISAEQESQKTTKNNKKEFDTKELHQKEFDKIKQLLENNKYDEISELKEDIRYDDAKDLIYDSAIELNDEKKYDKSLLLFKKISGYKNADWWVKIVSDEKQKEEKIEEKKDTIETIIQVIIFSSPVIMSIIFGIILFSNSAQIAAISNFTGWCVGWVVFTIASIITTIVTMVKRHNDWFAYERVTRLTSIIIAVIILSLSVVVCISASQLTRDFNPTKNIEFTVLSKDTSSKHTSTIAFTLKNNNDFNITYISGEMKFYNGSKEIAVWDVNFRANYH